MAVLARGGGALDAAIAAQMVLTLVEPQSSGIGGGAFLLHRDGRSNAVVAWDGRETAPADADERLFVGPDGKPLAFFDAVVGGRSVGVPGVLRMLEAAHARHGRLPWATLFEPAIRLATEGFEVSPRLHALLASERHLRRDAAAARHFYAPDGTPWPVGHRLRNPELADTLARIAREGSLALHAGPIAREIVAAVRGHPTNPGRLGERDLAFYAPVAREPLCTPWRRWVVCGMPPPSSGGVAVAQILGILEAARAPPRGCRGSARPRRRRTRAAACRRPPSGARACTAARGRPARRTRGRARRGARGSSGGRAPRRRSRARSGRRAARGCPRARSERACRRVRGCAAGGRPARACRRARRSAGPRPRRA